MHTPHRNRQRGEGKLGCIVSLLVFITLVAVAWQLVPALFSNNELAEACENIASRAVQLNQDNLQLQIRDKARELGIQEALAPGAIVVAKSGDWQAGVTTVRLNYTRKIEFYGIYTYPLKTEKTISINYRDYR